jgi:hypothetical protein
MDSDAPSAFPAACGEFPNDNPNLHRGGIWYCAHVVNAAVCDLRIAEPTPAEALCDDADDGSDAPWKQEDETVHAIETMAEAPLAVVDDGPRPADDEDDRFETFVQVLEDVMRGLGADDAATAGLHALLGKSRLDGISWSNSAVEALASGKLLDLTDSGLQRSEALTNRVLAWRGILRGESEDFGACGGATLDEWAADVVARALGNPARAEGIRRELRRRGVAAFGLVADAA